MGAAEGLGLIGVGMTAPVGDEFMITSPTLLIDEQKCRANIRAMTQKASKIIFRPHFKTHQSLELGRWFRDENVTKITVSSLQMARHFMDDGWSDITVAFPVNIREMDLINKLASSISLSLLIESVDAIEALELGLRHPVNVFIKVDLGYQRTGIASTNHCKIRHLLERLSKSKKQCFVGILSHAGHSYEARGLKELEGIHVDSVAKMTALKEELSSIHPEMLISLGDTPTCSVTDDFTGIDEIRPGNFVFYDLTQKQIGSCAVDQIAVAVACPVVAVHGDRNEVLIHGGGVHFSKETMEDEGIGVHYGQVAMDQGEGWGPLLESVYLKKLSQEHGTVVGPTEFIKQVKIGELLKILPVHSCMTAHLMQAHVHINRGL
jgi:D-serine deaminase-like pyridoxal phosphate-dependent protein